MTSRKSLPSQPINHYLTVGYMYRRSVLELFLWFLSCNVGSTRLRKQLPFSHASQHPPWAGPEGRTGGQDLQPLDNHKWLKVS